MTYIYNVDSGKYLRSVAIDLNWEESKRPPQRTQRMQSETPKREIVTNREKCQLCGREVNALDLDRCEECEAKICKWCSKPAMGKWGLELLCMECHPSI